MSKRECHVTPERSLARWFRNSSRVLPWREDPAPYRVWISEIMLQQTQVVAVIPYFERFVQRFPTVEALALAPMASVMSAWAGLGYYSRARNLHCAAQRVVAQGGFPRTREGWEALPGVGPYTAGAILSIAQGQPEAIVDGNVERVLARRLCLGRGTLATDQSRYKTALWENSRAFLQSAVRQGVKPSTHNQAIMELGALICTPKNPDCQRCPIQMSCLAFSRGEVALYPEKKPPKKWVHVQERALWIVNRRGQVLLRLASAGQWRAGLWDNPLVEDRARVPLLKAEQLLGQVEIKTVVTHHKIQRLTQLLRVSGSQPALKLQAWIAQNQSEPGELQWWDEVPEAAGSALKKTWRLVRQSFPGLSFGDQLQTEVLEVESSR